MKLIFSDLHSTKNLTPRVEEEQTQVINRIKEIIHNYYVDEVFFLGDLIDEKELIYRQAVAKLVDLFESASYVKFWIILGNHDFDKSPDSTPLQAFRAYNNVEIVDSFRVLDVYNKKVALFPYAKDATNYLKRAIQEKCNIVMSHLDIKDFKLNSLRKSMGGLVETDFVGIERVYSGHYHIYQKKTLGNCQITYVGSPLCLNFKDFSNINLIEKSCEIHEKYVVLIDQDWNEHNVEISTKMNFKIICDEERTHQAELLKEQLEALGNVARITKVYKKNEESQRTEISEEDFSDLPSMIDKFLSIRQNALPSVREDKLKTYALSILQKAKNREGEREDPDSYQK